MNLQGMMSQIQKAQKKMQQEQKELEEKLFEIVGAGGAIKIKIYGNFKVEAIEIDKDILDDVEMVQDSLVITMNEAIKTINEESAKITDKLSASMPSLPGGFPGF